MFPGVFLESLLKLQKISRMVESKRVTQSEIAEKAGVTQVTVSLALRKHASISEPTRMKIARIAKELGYRPDPTLSSLIAYRYQKKTPSFQGVLSWVTNYASEDGWRTGQQEGYFQGAQRQAYELGYKLETLWLNAKGMTPQRAIRILNSKNIEGLLFAPQPQPYTRLDMDVSSFSAVTFGYSLQSPALHVVMNHQFRNICLLIHQLRRVGYARIGLAMPSEHDERVNHNYLAGYLVEQENCANSKKIPYYMSKNKFSKEQFLEWFKKGRPDVVVTNLNNGQKIKNWLESVGFRIPEDLGIALSNIPFENNTFSGIDENPILVGATAVNVVVGMIHRNEKALPDPPRHVLLQGRWVQGKTILCPQNKRSNYTTDGMSS